jgi:two-component system, OmpR family, sensor histidine kinase KdpD
VYLPAVLLVSAYWGLALGLVTSLASAAAFSFFHVAPVGAFTLPLQQPVPAEVGV